MMDGGGGSTLVPGIREIARICGGWFEVWRSVQSLLR
jgi:hypothetical protein